MTEPLFPCTNALQTPNPPFWTTKTAVPKFPQNGGSTSTLCLDKAVHAQGGGVMYVGVPTDPPMGIPAADRLTHLPPPPLQKSPPPKVFDPVGSQYSNRPPRTSL